MKTREEETTEALRCLCLAGRDDLNIRHEKSHVILEHDGFLVLRHLQELEELLGHGGRVVVNPGEVPSPEGCIVLRWETDTPMSKPSSDDARFTALDERLTRLENERDSVAAGTNTRVNSATARAVEVRRVLDILGTSEENPNVEVAHGRCRVSVSFRHVVSGPAFFELARVVGHCDIYVNAREDGRTVFSWKTNTGFLVED